MPATRRVVVPELAASSTSAGSVRPVRPGPSTHTLRGATSNTRAPSASTIRRVARQSAESATLRTWLVPSARAPHISARWLIDLSPGPGGIHLLNGLYDAKMDGQPVLAITGHTFHDLIGTHFQQDVDLDKLFMDVAVYNERVMGPAHVVNVVDAAVRAALAQRGVAHITIPKDIQEWTLSDDQRSMMNVAKHSADVFVPVYPTPPQEKLRQAADVINAGSKVAILAGAGCRDAREEILQLAEKVAGPIVKPLLGKDVVPDDSPYTTGGIGLLGTAPSQDAIDE